MEPSKTFSPLAMLKSRRPERFSDTVRTDQPVLDRTMLEYQLETLTSRGQEKDFELFARHLAQKEICPNLLPQTGPTGGGDSKVDSETYPVAEELSFAWFVGSNAQEAANERWAFAFSAKSDWRSKVRSDVEKIARTGRGYKKAFFVTNQHVPDRIRAEVEDKLSKEFGLDLRILDRTWILDRVFQNRHEGLAIEFLRLQTSIRMLIHKGPLDVERERELDKVEERIKLATQNSSLGFAFVRDCLEAAELARALGLPRIEVDGRFERAKRTAERYGTQHQKLACAYAWAWTSYWWYEDYATFLRQYGEVQSLAEGSKNAYEFELISNLWYNLVTLTRAGGFDDSEIALKDRTLRLFAGLDALIKEEGRPSTALQARSLKLLMELTLSIGDAEKMSSIFRAIIDVIRDSRGLVGFPLEPLVDVIMELGKFLGELEGYQDLVEVLVEITAGRAGDVSAARLLMTRGTQQLNADRPADAIRTLGRALSRLYKHESRQDLVRALYACGVGYERVGLLWAARGTLLNAASIAANDFWSYQEITLHQACCYNQLKWLELKLLRFPQILTWHELSRRIQSALPEEQGPSSEEVIESEMIFDGIIGMKILTSELSVLKRLTQMPDKLEAMELFYSSIALRYALGEEGSLERDLKDCDAKPLSEFFRIWRDQPASEQTPGPLELYDCPTVTLSSSLLGCIITVQTENDTTGVILAESLLSAIESLMATGIKDRIIAQEPTLTISIQKGDLVEALFKTSFNEISGRHHINIRYSNFDWALRSRESRNALRDKIFELIASILARVFAFQNMEESLTRLFRDDRALERAIDFTLGFAATSNILGDNLRFNMSDWISTELHEYSLSRGERWDAKLPAPDLANTKDEVPAEAPTSKLTGERFFAGQVDHSQVQTVSLIRIPLWNQAQWMGTAFAGMQDNTAPPLIIPLFRDATAAGEIFRLWHEELGSRDKEERLRITILRGVIRSEPYTYRVIFGLNPEIEFKNDPKKMKVLVTRIQTMEPTSHVNLDNFIKSFHEAGHYGVAHCIMEPGSAEPEIQLQHVIIKRELFVRDAWQLGMNDVDHVGLLPDDDPIIPADQVDPPVLELLRRKRGK